MNWYSHKKAALVVGLLSLATSCYFQDTQSFSEQELQALVGPAVQAALASQNKSKTEVESTEESIIKRLKKFKVTGVAFAADPNFAFFYDHQNPTFNLAFKDHHGEVRTRPYRFSISSIGFKFQFTINLNLLFFVGTNLNLYASRKKIEIGAGFSFAPLFFIAPIPLSPLRPGFAYFPFKNLQGGMIMLTLALGSSSPELSIITGGSITPLRGKSYLDDFDKDEVDVLRGKKK